MTVAAATERDVSGNARSRARKRADRLFTILGLLAVAIALAVLLVLLMVLFLDGMARLSPDFLANFPSRIAARAGVASALAGSCLLVLTTAGVAIPLGVMAALYLEEYAPKNWLTDAIEIAVNNLAGVPSIVFGLLGLGVFVYGLHLGRSIATAGLTLALLILPILIVTTREALRAVPRAVKEAALALGATRWQATKDHVLPAATPGIVTGIIIGMSRALGETAPLIAIGALTFVAFLPVRSPGEALYAQVGIYNADGALQNPGASAQVRLPQGGEATLPDGEVRTLPPGAAELPTGTVVKTRVGLGEAVASWAPWNWLGESFSALPIQMFNWTSRPGEAFHENAAAAGLVLLALTLLLNGSAIWLRYRLRRAIRW